MNGPKNHLHDVTWSTVTDNYEPPRGYAYGVLEVWESTTGAEPVERVYVLTDARELKDAHRALYLIDDGRTVEPWYVTGWNDRTDPGKTRVFLGRMPTNYNDDGSPRLRADNGRPVDFSGWVLGPRRAYHLKVGA